MALRPLKAYYREAITIRGVQVGDVLGVVEWAATPSEAGFVYSLTLLEFTDGTRIYTETEEDLGLTYYRVRYESTVLAQKTGSAPTAWLNPGFDFGGREVSFIATVPAPAIQEAIKITSGGQLIPVTPYFRPAGSAVKHRLSQIDFRSPPLSLPIYGVSGLYQSDPALTRTDDAVEMSFAINSSTGAISSDFNDVFPWNEATVEEISGNKFVHMPEMWFRIGYDSSKRITDVAVSKQASGAGNWYKVESFYYSCYGGSVSSGKLSSVSGVSRQASITRAQFRSYATANGNGYFQEDLYHKNVMNFLWYIEWASKDSASIMTGRIGGSGTSGGANARPTGGTNSVTTPSGFETAYAQMRYHYIEDFVGNLREFVDGGVFDKDLYVSSDPTSYSDVSTNLVKSNLVRNANGDCLAALGWDEANPFLCYGVETVTNTSYNTYFCDQPFITNSTSPVLVSGAHYSNATAAYGISSFTRASASNTLAYYGGRLLYKPEGG